MPYSSFTLKEVKKVFGITPANSQFSRSATPVIPSNWLNDLFQESIPLATTLSTEKARSEFIIAPCCLNRILSILHWMVNNP